ncbi:MAG: PIG-L family deacetylase [Actinomycetota bacterium]|jgi:LmbE family N-acetylglucosaminyl deacetylase|nr:PIG-L family deacetylase [Actinomycetota bacterium]
MPAEPAPTSHDLPPARSVLAVCAHPDDESFGLGAVLHRFAESGAEVAFLCFTRGEASTLGTTGHPLGEIRRAELVGAAAELGIRRVELLEHPDSSLASEPLDRLAEEVAGMAAEAEADLVVVFDEDGVTGHPDHRRATEAALAGAQGLPVLAWTLPRSVADTLNAELGTSFRGHDEDAIDMVLRVDRTVQQRAIACHASQCADNPVLARRLALLGDHEHLRWLRAPAGAWQLYG